MQNWSEALKLLATLAISGWVAAYLTSLIKRERWPSSVKLVLALVLSTLCAVASLYLGGDVTTFIAKWGSLTAADVMAFGSLIFVSAQLWYHKLWPTQGWATTISKWGDK
jgi:hypothetical protein